MAKEQVGYNQASLDPAVLLCLWRDVRGTGLLKNEKLASRCFRNFRKQHLCQNNGHYSTPIDLDPWFEDVNVTGTETGHCYGDHHGLAKISCGF